MTNEDAATGRLLWRITTRWRAAVDRAVAPLGLTHAQYVLLGSLYDLTRAGGRPSQRELADFAGLEPIYVSKLVRALRGAGLVTRTEHPADPRAFQVSLTDKGADVITRALTVVHTLQDELTAPIGGTAGTGNRALVRTLQTLLDPPDRSEPVTQPPVLTGQHIAEAQGAVRGLHEHILHGSDSSSNEHITLRVVAGRGPWANRSALRDYLAGQAQLDLDHTAATGLLDELAGRGLITADDPVTLTAPGADLLDRLTAEVREVTTRLYAGLAPDDLTIARQVLVEVTKRANRLRQDR